MPNEVQNSNIYRYMKLQATVLIQIISLQGQIITTKTKTILNAKYIVKKVCRLIR